MIIKSELKIKKKKHDMIRYEEYELNNMEF